MAPVIADSAQPIKKHGRGRPRKGEERVKKVYVPTGRPRGRPKGSRNTKTLDPIATSISNSVPVATVSAVPPPSTAASQANIATPTPIPLPASVSSTSASTKSPALSATTANAAAAAAAAADANRSAYVPTGRPRGRPRKDGLPPQQRKPFPSPTSSSPTSSTAVVAAVTVASPGNPAKRGRGRPRKVVQPSVEETMDNDTLVNEAESGKLPFLLLDTFYTTTAGHG